MEEQAEEYEVLDSIYGSGDDRFKSITETAFQYRFGEEGDNTSFLLEIRWPPEYPSVIPEFSLSSFFNQHLSTTQKAAVLKLIVDEAEKNLGQVQTYTMIEWVRENYERIAELIKSTTSSTATVLDAGEDGHKEPSHVESNTTAPKVKKEQLTKNQKRREWDRLDAKGEKPRGFDWVDVIKHLSQTGGQQS